MHSFITSSDQTGIGYATNFQLAASHRPLRPTRYKLWPLNIVSKGWLPQPISGRLPRRATPIFPEGSAILHKFNQLDQHLRSVDTSPARLHGGQYVAYSFPIFSSFIFFLPLLFIRFLFCSLCVIYTIPSIFQTHSHRGKKQKYKIVSRQRIKLTRIILSGGRV